MAKKTNIKDSEKNFDILFKLYPNPVTIVSALTNRFVNVNESFLRESGYSKEEVIGRTSEELNGFLLNEAREEIIRELKKLDVVAGKEVFLRHKNGNILKCLISATIIFINDESHFLSILTNLAQHEMTQNLLVKRNSVFNNSLAAIGITDPNGVISEVNSQMALLYGFSDRSEMSGIHISNFLADPPSANQILRDLEKDGKWEGRFTARKLTGDSFIAHCLATVIRDSDETLLGFQATILDETERITAEVKARQGQELFDNVSEQISDVIFISDIQGRSKYLSASVKKVFGYTQDELNGEHFLKCLHEDSIKPAMDGFAKALNSKKSFHSFTLTMRRKDGSCFPAELKASRFYQHGVVAGFIGTIRDVSETMKAMDEIKKSKEIQDQFYKHLNTIREHSRAVISREIHDQLGQSLTAIKLDIDFMKNMKSLETSAKRKLNDMSKLVTETIKETQRISAELHPRILDELGLTAAVEWYSEEFEKRSRISVEVNLAEIIVRDSMTRLTLFRILQEALTNVARHSKAGKCFIHLYKKNRQYCLEISDDGIGITTGQMSSSSSMGILGMFERVRQMNGTLELTSRSPHGTTVFVTIPVQ